MNLIFFGPPGTGKGTYASRIGPKLGIPHISTGDIFRDAVKKETELGKKVKGLLDRGELVDDETVNQIVKERLGEEDAKNGHILDGYPRTPHQANFLESLSPTDLVINLNLSDEMILEKAMARRICEKCGKIYNVADIEREGIRLPPLLPESGSETECDCGGSLVQRKDDNEETIRDRIATYRKQSEPLVGFYREKGLLQDVKVVGPPDVVVPIIMEEIEKSDT